MTEPTAEHRAEVDRLKGELAEARGLVVKRGDELTLALDFIQRVCDGDVGCIAAEDFLAAHAAPPSAAPTPVRERTTRPLERSQAVSNADDRCATCGLSFGMHGPGDGELTVLVNHAFAERAHAILRGPTCDHQHWKACDSIATALARVRIEAHAAGRDEGLTKAEEAVAIVDCASKADVEVVNDCLRAIRALRGRG